MKRRPNYRKIGLTLGSLVAILLILATAVLADGPAYTLNWWTVDGGGGQLSSVGGEYVLNGTAGQPETENLGDETYTLQGGFWSGGEVTDIDYVIHLPLVLRTD